MRIGVDRDRGHGRRGRLGLYGGRLHGHLRHRCSQRHRRGRTGGIRLGLGFGAQDDAVTVILNLCLDPALNFTFGDAVQHGCIGGGRFGPEIAILGGQIAEVFRNRLHRVERIVKPLQSAGEGSVGYRKDLTRTDHRMLAFCQVRCGTVTR